MPDQMLTFPPLRRPTADLPLQGQTVLVVDDSRYASEALRLMCLRSGARIRRADCLRSARRHLMAFNPSVVIVDIGLPDGRGTELIAELASGRPRPPVLLGTSGDDGARVAALDAGADGFLEKPLRSLGSFQQEILSRQPVDARPLGVRAVPTEDVEPDLCAYRDDLAHAAVVLGAPADESQISYLTQFLAGVAAAARDTALSHAIAALETARRRGTNGTDEIACLTALVRHRLDRAALG